MFGEAFWGLALQVFDDVYGEELLVGLGQDGRGAVVLVDAELGEEGLVEQASDARSRQGVGITDVRGELQRLVEVGEQLVVVGLELGNRFLGAGALASDAGLLFLEQRLGDALLVVLVQELSFLLEQPFERAFGLLDLGFGESAEIADVPLNGVPGPVFADSCDLAWFSWSRWSGISR